MLQHTVAAVVDTRIWDGTPNQALLAWLGDDGHHFDGTQLVIHTTDGDMYPEPGWTIVRWPDRDLSVMSSRAATKRLAPAELMGMRLVLDPSAPPGSVTLSTTRPGRMPEADEPSSVPEEVVHLSPEPQVGPPRGVDERGSGTDFTSPLTGIEVRVPCPYCPPPAMIPRTLIAEHYARMHPGISGTQAPTEGPECGTAPGCDGQCCAGAEADAKLGADPDEEAHRTDRRERLDILTARAYRGVLTQLDASALRNLIDDETREADIAHAVATGNKQHVQVMWQELEKAHARAKQAAHERDVIAADLETADQLRAEAQRDRDQHAAVLGEVLATFVHKVDGYRIPRFRSGDVDVVTLEKWRSMVAPVDWQTIAQQRERELKTAAEARRRAEMAIARVRLIRKTPSRSPFNLAANAQDDGWDQALDAVHAALGAPEPCETGNARKDHPVHELLAALEAGVPHPDPRDLIGRYYQAIHELCCPYDHTEQRPGHAAAANRATLDEPKEH
ncbi:hypothetical protein IHE56_15195 [Streptomyces sp. ID01-12c]|uniref:hypothetical protein n=1 Tax=Streptomyces caniscabiei TaxID=2746961 RepID=UPI0017845438|nr:hypothetical protein [Streptomyces caniscabiei]MBD9703403.1 hypothetical protein [Streptomyces caniscabiei]MDX3726893.1 hypothetical protein [Streptomyces caniscabiei]